ncbi:MAG TPA: P-loop NTPase [Kiritimatiellia bacterium]|mgnify:CR=1 FL=1|nr:P-loop NTPase [Kiritimatiellia bacterium]HMO98263.1 P-loop NTPase [Kiritimatiellia bacterium]HMP96260.1 P-loop NTPase [Kiritimatiellia bacterium]
MTRTDDVLQQLARITEPHQQQDIVTLGMVQNLSVDDGGLVSFTLDAATQPEEVRQKLKTAVEEALTALPWVTDVMVMLAPPRTVRENPLAMKSPGLRQVRRIIAVSSCKGGVGKSTVAVNLAYALSGAGHKVGLFDADIYGPSLPTMVQIQGAQLYQENDMIIPLAYLGVKLMSFGFIPSASGAAIMRGPMVTQIINQLLTTTNWGPLDYLVLDLPPGTGDVQLTLTQLIPITAAVIVTTPQQLSFVDVVKGIQMFDKLKVPTIALVENMSYFECPGCSTRHHLFGQGARQRIVDQYGIARTFELPIQPDLSQCGDGGIPYVLMQPKSETTRLFSALASAVHEEVDRLERGLALRPRVAFVPGEGIRVTLDDRHQGLIHPAALRRKCRCANCVEEFSGKPLLKPEEVPDHVYPVRMQPMGNYAMAIQWSDGHASSIYPYDMLLELAGLQLPEVTV